MGMLGGLQRPRRARGEQSEDDVVGPMGKARIGVRGRLGQRQQIRPQPAVPEAVTLRSGSAALSAAARSAWLGP